MIHFKADITDISYTFIAHGCNAQGKFGKGVAASIASKWPEAKEVYLARQELGLNRLGSFHHVRTHDDRVIFNCITQDGYGSDGRKYASYLAVIESLTGVMELLENLDPLGPIMWKTPLAIPKIGCGYGGLKWDVLKPILEEIEEKYFRQFVVVDNQ